MRNTLAQIQAQKNPCRAEKEALKKKIVLKVSKKIRRFINNSIT